MRITFHAERDPSKELFDAMAALTPDNPFYTSAYAEAMRMGGQQVWVFALRDGDRLLSACTGFLKDGRLSRWFEIPSLPALGANERDFWEGLLKFCRRCRVSNLEVNTFASVPVRIPAYPVPTRRIDRTEYLIDLRQSDLWSLLRKGHRWSINRGRKAGLVLRSSASGDHCQDHCQMVDASMRRRGAQCEIAQGSMLLNQTKIFLSTGAGVLFQAIRDGIVFSSALVLLSRSGAYYQSTGSSAEGMEQGASVFLVFEIAKNLQERKLDIFNLGGVSGVNPGLQEFKAGFGTTHRPLTAAEYDLRTRLRKNIEGALRCLHSKLSSAARLQQEVLY
jgi:hypothetical protein